MPTPRLGAPEWVAAQNLPEDTGNEISRYLEAFGNCTYFISRAANPAEPGSPADGDVYLLTGTPTGTHWAGHDDEIALFVNTAWVFITPQEGFLAWVVDENVLVVFDGGAWGAPAVVSAPAPVTVQTGTAYTADISDANSYIQFDNASPIAFTIPPHSSEAFPVDTEMAGEQTGAGALSIVAGAGVTINSRGSLTDLAGQFGVFGIKQTAIDEWTLTGDLV